MSSGSVGDLVMFSTGGTVQASGEGARIGTLGTAGDERLPLTAAQAVAAGWKDPILCSVGRGRYFQKTGSGADEVPYFLMFGGEDALIGLYQFSETEMAPPWRQIDDLLGGGGLKLLDEHWGLFIYFQDPVRACGVPSQTTRRLSCCADYPLTVRPHPSICWRPALALCGMRNRALASLTAGVS